MALNLEKASPLALMNAAKAYLAKNNPRDAEAHIKALLAREPKNAEALSLLGEVYTSAGARDPALGCMIAAINADPAERRYKERFIEAARHVAPGQYVEAAERAVIECLLSGDELDCTHLRIFWVTMLVRIPAFHEAFGLLMRKSFDPANKAFFESYTNFKPLFTPYVLLGLCHIVVGDAMFEEFLTHIRRHLLLDFMGDRTKFSPEETTYLATALSYYAFNTDYIFDVSEEEQAALEGLRAKTEAAPAAENLAVLAAYMPLHHLANAEMIAREFPDNEVVQAHIIRPAALLAKAAEIPALTEIDGGVSAQVRAQYEEFPYPRWKKVPLATQKKGWRARNKAFTGDLFDQSISILNAGCGTGQEAVMLAGVHPAADILAVDLSRASLAYAAQKAQEHDLGNITFRQADILKLGDLDRRFDIIVSAGVLHHMQAPMEGWRVLTKLLKPGGRMMIGLYSKTARWAVLAAQAAAKQNGYANDAAGMKRFRKDSPRLLPPDVLKDLTTFSDYYKLNMYRDLLFHVQEHNYTIGEIEETLKACDLEFLGFSINYPVQQAYAKAFPEDKAMTSFDNWREFERKNPNTFREMYYIWCRKK